MILAYLNQGLLEKDTKKLAIKYMQTWYFKVRTQSPYSSSFVSVNYQLLLLLLLFTGFTTTDSCGYIYLCFRWTFAACCPQTCCICFQRLLLFSRQFGKLIIVFGLLIPDGLTIYFLLSYLCRFNRLIRVYRMAEFFDRTETRTSYPNTVQISVFRIHYAI